jgi:hypothetical protein
MKQEPNAKGRKSATKGKGGKGRAAREYVGFYALAGTKNAARKKLRGQTITRYCLNALQSLINGEREATQPGAHTFGDPMVTEAQAAALLGITRPTLRAIRLQGGVEFYQLGERLIRYDPKYLRESFLPKFKRGAEEGANGNGAGR